MVIACNTGTAAGLAIAQRAFDVPVVGVVEPGARAAVRATLNRRIGVIATVGTVESGAYARAVRALDEGVTVFSVATPKFVDVVEAGLRMGPGQLEDWLSGTADVFVRPSFFEMARDYLNPLKHAGIDTLILGCTHFPLLSAAIGQAIGPKVTLISSAEQTAREVRALLELRGHLRQGEGRIEFATTGDPGEFARLGSRVLRARIEQAEHVELDDLRSHRTERLDALLREADSGDAA